MPQHELEAPAAPQRDLTEIWPALSGTSLVQVKAQEQAPAKQKSKKDKAVDTGANAVKTLLSGYIGKALLEGAKSLKDSPSWGGLFALLGTAALGAAAYKGVDAVASTIKDPEGMAKEIDVAWAKLTDPVGTVQKAMASLSANEAAKLTRELAIMVVTQGTVALLDELAAAVPGSQFVLFLKNHAKGIATCVGAAFGYELHRLYPMFEVDPSSPPKPDEEYLLLGCLPSTVKTVGKAMNGAFDATLELTNVAMGPIAGSGTTVVQFVDHTRVFRIDTSGLTLVIGGITLTKIVADYAAGVGLTVRSAEAAAKGGAISGVTLQISPMGWLSGSYTRDGRACKLGSEFPRGIDEPKGAPAKDAPKDPTALATSSGSDGSFAGTLAAKIRGELTPARMAQSLLSTGLSVVSYVSDGRNLVKDKSAPAQTTPPPATEASPTSKALGYFGLDPTAMLGKLSKISLVPDGLSKKVALSVDELYVGEEPSVNIGVSASIRPFENQPERAGVHGMRLIWLVDKPPHLLVQADQLVVDSQHAVFCGIEADPTDGLRMAAARIALPGIAIGGDDFSIKDITATAEGVRVGRNFQARSLRAVVEQLVIAKVLTVGAFSVTMEGAGSEDKKFTGEVTQGKLALPDVELDFNGSFSWGQKLPIEADAKISLGKPVAITDTLTLEAASGTIKRAAREWAGSGSASFKGRVLDRYQVEATDAAFEVDSHGVKRVTLAAGKLSEDGKQLGAVEGFEYERGKTLKLKRAVIALPTAGVVRATPANDKDATPPSLVFDNIDMSDLVAAKAPKDGAKDAPKVDRSTWKISGQNLGRVTIGDDVVIVDFTQAPKASPDASGLHAKVSLNLGPLGGSQADVAVEPPAEGLEHVKTTLSDVKIGKSANIARAVYDGATLDVSDATIDVTELLGPLWPSDLAGLDTKLTVNLIADPKAGKITKLTVAGSANGSLFGEHITLKDTEVAVTLENAQLAGPKSKSVVEGGALSGGLKIGELSMSMFGATVKAEKSSLSIGPSLTGTLNAKGTVGKASIDVKNLRFLGDKKVMLDSVTTTIAQAEEGDVVKYLPPKSAVDAPINQPVTISLHGVGYDAATGEVLFAHEEDVTANAGNAEQAASTAVPSGLDVANLGGIDVADGAFTVTVTDTLSAAKVKGKNEVEVKGGAQVAVGPLTGEVTGQVYVAFGHSARDPKTGIATPIAQKDRVRVHITKGSIGDGLVINDAWIQSGHLWMKSATIQAGKLLGKIPGELGEALSSVSASITDLDIDPKSKKFSGTAGLTLESGISMFDKRLEMAAPSFKLTLKPGDLAGGALAGEHWSATLGAGKTTVKPVDAIGFEATSGELEVGPDKLSGTITKPTVTLWALGATAESISIDRKGFMIHQAGVCVDTAGFTGLGGPAAGLVPALPGWIGGQAGAYPFLVKLTGLSFGYQDGSAKWPALKDMRFSIRRAGLKLGPVEGGFDLDKGAVKLGLNHKGEMKLAAQLPVGHGVGVEVGGGLDYAVAFDTEATASTENDLVRATANLTAQASLTGVAYVGLYGGVPSVFSAAAGLYAGVSLDAGVTAKAAGSLNLPTATQGPHGGQLDLSFELKGPDGKYPLLSGVAGAYASLHFLGTSRTIKKELARMKIVELHAHGAMQVRPGQPLRLLPGAGEFPSRSFHLDPDLEAFLFDTDFNQELVRSQHRLDKSFATVRGTEAMLNNKPADAKPDDKPWEKQKGKLDEEAHDAVAELKEATRALKELDAHDAFDANVLAALRDKLAKYEWRHEKLLEAERKAKIPSMRERIASAIVHPKWGAEPITLVEGVPCIKTRIMKEGSVAERVNAKSFPKQLGLSKEQKPMSAKELAKKIKAKQAEIEYIEAQRAKTGISTAQDRKAVAEANELEASTKAQLATGSVQDATSRLDKERDKLLDSLYAASKVQAKSDDKQLEGKARIKALEADKTETSERMTKLEAEIAKAPADVESLRFELAFWTAHLDFLKGEVDFVTKREADRSYAKGQYTDGIDPTKAETLARAATARPEKKKKIDDQIRTQIEARRTAIETSLKKLGERLADIKGAQSAAKSTEGSKPTEQHATQVKRLEAALEVEKAQLRRYVDNIARLSALMTDKDADLEVLD